MSHEAINTAVRAHYEGALATHGVSAAGVNWKDRESHQLRHRQFLPLVRGEPEASVLDLGCGYGDFLTFLRAHGHRGHYLGLDVSPAMIEAARALHGQGPDHDFALEPAPDARADYAVASGVLNVIRGAAPEAWAAYVEATIEGLASRARRGFGFNMLSLESDPKRRRADLYYGDPAAVVASLERYGSVALSKDYGLWEFTVLVRL